MRSWRQPAKSKTCVWCWQEGIMSRGFEGLLCDQTRPPGISPCLRRNGPQGLGADARTSWSQNCPLEGSHDGRRRRNSRADGGEDLLRSWQCPPQPAYANMLSVDKRSQIQALIARSKPWSTSVAEDRPSITTTSEMEAPPRLPRSSSHAGEPNKRSYAPERPLF